MSWPNRALVITLCLGMSLAATRASAEDDLRVLENTQQPILYDYLLKQVALQAAERRRAVDEALQSPEALQARAEALRSSLRTMLGPLPQRTPLNARTVGTIQCDGYRIEKVIYDSRPNHHVTANLYLPDKTAGKIPGVLVPCGHSDNGKASTAYQSVCVLLALNGCAALIYDPIGQGERHQIAELTRHGTTEHTLVGIGALLVGWNAANYRVWDGLRSMDYLASRPEVDPARLGCTGNSGGGTMTTWLMAIDERIAVAAPSCFITTLERLFNTIGPQDCEQHFPGQGAAGIDHTDFITMRAPKPTLILAAERDFFDFGGTRQAFAEAQAVYQLLGQGERVGLFSYNDEHGFSQPRREAAVGWMRRWLCDDDRPVSEPAHTLQKDADLQVTRTGQVLNDFEDEQTVIDFAKRRAAELGKERAAAWSKLSDAQREATIKQALGVRSELAKPAIKRLENVSRVGYRVSRAGYSIEKLVIGRPEEVPLPGLLFVPEQAEGAGKLPAVIWADSRGKAAAAEADGEPERLARAGNLVLAVDLRGYGETLDTKKGQYQNDEFRTAMLAMHLGRPLLGQRVEDLLAAWEVVSQDARVDRERISVVGVGRAGPVALHAAAIEPRISGVRVCDSIGSWTEDVVARPLGDNLMGHVLPGVLGHYDLPELQAMLTARLAGEKSPRTAD